MASAAFLLATLALVTGTSAFAPRLFSVIEEEDAPSFPACFHPDVVACKRINVDFSLLTAETQEITLHDGHILSKRGPIDVSDTAKGFSYMVSH